MTFKQRIAYKKGSELLLSTCRKLIAKYENPQFPSCESDIIACLNKNNLSSPEIVIKWQNSNADFEFVSNALLSKITFNFLSSGKYHLYAGELNPLSCAGNLMRVYNGAMQYAVDNGYTTTESKEEQYQNLLQLISEVG